MIDVAANNNTEVTDSFGGSATTNEHIEILRGENLECWKQDGKVRNILHQMFMPYKGNKAITERVDYQHCNDGVVWCIVNLENNDILPASKPPSQMVSQTEQWLVSFLSQAKGRFKSMAEGRYLSTANSVQWKEDLIKGTDYDSFNDFEDLKRKLSARTDETVSMVQCFHVRLSLVTNNQIV